MASFDSSTPYNTATPPPPPPKPQYTSVDINDYTQAPPLPVRPSQRTDWPQQVYDQGASQSPAPPQANSYSPQAPASQQPHTQLAPQEGWIPQLLLDTSKPELARVLANPTILTALLHSPSTAHPSLAASQEPLQALLAQNIALATHVLHLLAELTRTRDAVSSHLLSARALERAWKNKQADLERELEQFGPRVLHRRLGEEIADEDARCRGIEESFLDGEGMRNERETGEWIKRVREGRRLVVLRRERKARWDEGRVGGWR